MQSIREEAEDSREEHKEQPKKAGSALDREDEKHSPEALSFIAIQQQAERNEKLWARAIRKYKERQKRLGETPYLDNNCISLAAQQSLKKEMIAATMRFHYRQATGEELPQQTEHHKKKSRHK
jgi:hypothetical protein